MKKENANALVKNNCMSLVNAQVNKVDSRGENNNSYITDHASCMPKT